MFVIPAHWNGQKTDFGCYFSEATEHCPHTASLVLTPPISTLLTIRLKFDQCPQKCVMGYLVDNFIYVILLFTLSYTVCHGLIGSNIYGNVISLFIHWSSIRCYPLQSCLFECLQKTKLIVDSRSCHYARCGRTDKGVSALGQVSYQHSTCCVLPSSWVYYPRNISKSMLVPFIKHPFLTCYFRLYPWRFVRTCLRGKGWLLSKIAEQLQEVVTRPPNFHIWWCSTTHSLMILG